ncbi:MAG: response regulator [Spirochaetes bacterium]|nr:response regulator [Spirochaetota bacterium]MBU1081559.1 response regulator [Spirochaetota bacterium]
MQKEDAKDAGSNARPTVLVVDDTPDNILVLSELLRDRYRLLVARNGAKALALAEEARPDLILLDIMMPGMDGYEVIGRLKASESTRLIPVIFLTAMSDVDDERKGFELGAVDYITKPISPSIVIARVATHMTLSRARQFLEDQNAYLESEVARRVEELDRVQDIFGKIVDPRIRDHLLKERGLMAGDVTEGAVLFCDIRSFTAFSESRDPRAVIAFLNAFFTEAAACVEAEGGFINKYLGDAFMAVFGTPFSLDDFRSSAVRAALAVRGAVAGLNARSGGEDSFRIGIGLHAGPMVAGIVGSPRRMEFTTIGDTVNTASRMEGLCKEQMVDFLVSEDCLRGTAFLEGAKPLGEVAIRGRERRVAVYTI